MVNQRNSRRTRSNGLADLHPLIRLWVLRLLVPLGGDARGAPRARDYYEAGPVSELHFTPGNPRNVRVGLSYLF